MGKKVYKAADLQIITEGSVVDFDLFIANETKTAMSVLVAKNSLIDGTMKVRLREIEKLYFDAQDSASLIVGMIFVLHSSNWL
jgi:hypothetical protein